jgi:hypothetical protein
MKKCDTKMESSVWLLVILACGMVGAVVEPGREICAQATPSLALKKDVKIPFTLENRHIFLQVQAGGTRPYWFVLDTGWKYASVDLAVAKALGLKLGAPVNVGGGGKKTLMGNLLSDSPFSLVGLKNFSQPLFLALPLDELAKNSGHEWAGTLGADFISEFVVEIDYLSKTITLHDKKTYRYRGNRWLAYHGRTKSGYTRLIKATLSCDISRQRRQTTYALERSRGRLRNTRQRQKSAGSKTLPLCRRPE